LIEEKNFSTSPFSGNYAYLIHNGSSKKMNKAKLND